MTVGCPKENYILIYGAHLVALECFRDLCLSGNNDRVLGFAVTDKTDNPDQLAGKAVKNIEDYAEYASECHVVIAMPQKYHDSVETYARKLGFNSFDRVDLETMSKIKGRRLVSECSVLDLRESANDVSWLDAYFDGKNGTIRVKFPTLFHLDEEMIIKESLRLRQLCDAEIPHIMYLDSLSQREDVFLNPDFEVYMVFDKSNSDMVVECMKHKRYDSWIRPLCAGSRIRRPGMEGVLDDQDIEEVADKNSFFAEMTGAYWIWKQAPATDYKGLCHYRRHFVLTQDDIKSIKSYGIDVVLTTPRFVPGGLRKMFIAETPVKEPVMDSMLSAIDGISPEDSIAFRDYLEGSFYSPNNMVIAKSEIYNGYSEWIFSILFRMLEIDQFTDYGHETDRHLAYAAELLTSYYFTKKNNYMIAYTDYRFIGQIG